MRTDLIQETISLKDFIEKLVGMPFEEYEKSALNFDIALEGEVEDVESDLARFA